MLKKRIQHVHLVGIGGAGMCGIAEVLLTLGYSVSGSDLKMTETTAGLKKRGARVSEGHRPENLADAQVLVYSSAVSRDNAELSEARRRRIPIIRRAEMLAELMRLKKGIAIAGSHGKTTTTSMVGAVLVGASLDPTVVIGGRVDSYGGYARVGKGEHMVVEADESDASFLCLSPMLSVITNIDDDHLDHYRSADRIQAAFVEFSHRVPFYGSVVTCLDDPGVRVVLPELSRRTVTYGLTSGALIGADRASFGRDGASFRVLNEGTELGMLKLRVPGRHNLTNALAAVAVGLELDIPFDDISRALQGYSGVDRRLQLKGEAGGIRILDDYGHHPTEIRATLEAARQMLGGEGRLLVLFQPHRYSRTNLLRDSFGGAFVNADEVTLSEIYAAGETPIAGVSAGLIREAIERHGRPPVRFVPELGRACEEIAGRARPGDIVLTLGAGDVGRCGERILSLIARK